MSTVPPHRPRGSGDGWVELPDGRRFWGLAGASGLLAVTPDRALLLITHRLTGLEAVDEVVVLEQGRAVERGMHAELLAAGGRYAVMWARETGSEAGVCARETGALSTPGKGNVTRSR